MSTTIDNRVVEMQFDNGQFEKNVQVSIKSLEELKKSLELDKAASSLSNLEKAANNFDLSSIEDAVTSLQKRFSTLGIIGMTALENITNKAVNAGAQMLKSLSIDQIASGMSKYEAETASVATMRYAIKGGLTEEGTERIYDTIEKLQKYADETSYSFSTMVDNMGKFVNAGVELDKAEQSMEGIANWAAKSGVSAQSANFSRVMYNLSQAMGQGQVKLMDWMSIENAQMATMDFKNQVLETAVAVGTLTKKGDKYYTKASKGNKSVEVTATDMRNSLQKGWFTADVLTKVLGKYADQTTEFGHEAFLAAQQARTFTDAVEATKDAVSTGWARSFRIIFGDINQATELFTGMTNGMIEVVDRIQEFRNGILSAWAASKGREALIEAFANIWHMLEGIANEVARAFGWLVDGTADAYGQKLAELSEGFRDLTEKGLHFFGKREVQQEAEATTKTSKEIVGGLEEITKWSDSAEGAIRGMISKQMKPGTVDKWNAAADAIKDLNDYAKSGAVDADVLNQKIANVEQHLKGLQKTNKLKSSKQNALVGMLKNLNQAASVERETAEVTREVEGDVEEAESYIEYYSTRLRPILQGMADGLGILSDTLMVTGERAIAFGSKFQPLIGPILGLGGAIGSLISHIRETGVVTDSVRVWLDQLAESFTPLTDKIETVAGWITDLWHIVYDRDFNEESGIEKGLGFLNGPIGDKIMNIAMGIQAAGNIIVRSVSAVLNILSSFVATFLLPLVGPTSRMVLDFFSGLGKVLVGLDRGFAGADAMINATTQIKNFFNYVKELIVTNPIFQRAKTILTSFFSIFSRDPKAAVNYLRAVGRGLMDGIKKSELYKKAAGYMDSFSKGIVATFKNSRTLRKAKAYLNSFFKAFKRDPKTAVKALRTFVKNMVLFSKPVQALKGFAEKAHAFLADLFPQKGINRVQQRMNNLKSAFQKTWEQKGLAGIMDLTKQLIQNKLREWGDAFANSTVGKRLLELKNFLVNTWTNLMQELEDNPFVQRITAFLDRLSKAYEENGISGALELLKTTITNKFEQIKEKFLQNEIVQSALMLKNRLAFALSDFATKLKLQEKYKKFKDWIADLKKVFMERGPISALTKLKTALASRFTTFTTNFNLQHIIETVQDWIKTLKESIQGANVAEAFDDLKKTIVDKIKNLFPKPEDVIETGGDETQKTSIIDSIKERMGSWIEALQTGLTDITKKLNMFGLFAKVFLVLSSLVTLKVFAGFGQFLSGMGKLGKRLSGEKPQEKLKNLSQVLVSLAIAIGVLAGAIAILSTIPQDRLNNATSALITCLTAIALMAAGIKALGLEAAMKSIMQAGIGIGAVALAILFLTKTTQMLGEMDWSKFMDGLGAVIILLGVMATFLWAVNKTGGNKFNANWASILAVAGAVVVLLLAVSKIASMNPEQAKQGVLSVMGLIVALGGAMALMNITAQNGTVKSAIQVIAVATAIGRLAKSVEKLGSMDTGVLKQGLIAVGILMAMLGLLSKLGGATDPVKIGSMVVSSILVVGLILVFSESLKKVADIPWETMIGFAVSLGIFLVTLAASLAILASVPIAGIIQASIGIGVAIVALGAALSLAALMGGNTAQALAGDMWVVGSKLADFSTMVSGLDTESINTAIQVMKDFAAAAVEVVGTPDLSTFRTTMINVSSDISLFSTNVAGIDTTKMNSSLTFMKNFASAAKEVIGQDYSQLATFGKTMQQVGSNMRLYSLLTADIDVSKSEIIKTAAADIGAVYESLKDVKNVGDLTEAITNIGSALKLYYGQVNDITPTEGEGPDLTKVKQIFKDLAAAMPDSTTIGDISSYAKGGGNDMTQFALGLTAIGTSLKSLAEDVSGITTESLQPALDLIGVLTDLNESLKPENFSLDFLGVFHVETEEGAGDLQQFSTDIVALGTAIKDYGTQVEGVTSDKIQTSLDALDFFTELRNKIGEGTGFKLDFLSVFTGKRQAITDFAEDIVSVGGALKDYATKIQGVSESDVTASLRSLRLLAALNNLLPNTGGLVSWIQGEKNLSSFGSDLSTLGDGVAQYADKVTGKDFTNVEASVAPLSALADVQNKLGNTNGLAQLFSGIQSLSGFGGELKSVGEGVAKFADETAGHDFSKAKEAVAPLAVLADMHSKIQSVSNWVGLNQFGETLPGLGTNLVAFQNGAEGLDQMKCLGIVSTLTSLISAGAEWATVGDAVAGATKMREFLNNLVNGRTALFDGHATFTELAGKLATDFWSAFYQAVNDQNGSYNVIPGLGGNLSPTITPVYDMGNLNGVNGTVAGQVNTTLDTTGATLKVSAVSNAIGQMSIGLNSKLESISTTLSQFKSMYDAGYNVYQQDLTTINGSIGELGDRLSLTIDLDGNVIAAAVAPKVDKLLGKNT